MENKINDNKNIANNIFLFYFLRISIDRSIYDNINEPLKFNDKYIKHIKEYKENIKKNKTNDKLILENIDKIINFTKRIQGPNVFLKSKGELLTFVLLILSVNYLLSVNKKILPNVNTNRNLEFDFHFGDTNNIIIIEVDGKQHKKNSSINKNDKLKDLIIQELNDPENNKLMKIIRFNELDKPNIKEQKFKEIYETIKIELEETNLKLDSDFSSDSISNIVNIFYTKTKIINFDYIIKYTDDTIKNLKNKLQILESIEDNYNNFKAKNIII